ncbi:hypothetical protein P0L94_09760 [Microbacter sp. GSS18]|nr:hypothetical protein P0L94_09760 [Microbacter sp. GSS18]
MYHAIFAQSLFTPARPHPNAEVAHLQRVAREAAPVARRGARDASPIARPTWSFRLVHPIRAHRAAVAAH